MQMVDLAKMRDLCNVLEISLLQIIQDEVDESVRDLDSWLASDLEVETIGRLNSSVERLFKIKLERFTEVCFFSISVLFYQGLQIYNLYLCFVQLKKRSLNTLSYWDAIPVPFEEKQEFLSLIYYVDVDSVDEITEANALSLKFINKVSFGF